jgi:Flp pilus assembly protein TadG
MLQDRLIVMVAGARCVTRMLRGFADRFAPPATANSRCGERKPGGRHRTPSPTHRVERRSLWRDDGGAVIAIVALTVSVLLAVLGYAIDTGWWYTIQRQNQSAADAGAIAAAYELVNNNTNVANYLIPAASRAATVNRYTGAAPIDSCVSTTASRLCNPYNGSSSLVEVVLRQPQDTWFANVAGLGSVTIATRAVAKKEVLNSPCMYVLSPTAPQALTIQGSSTLNAPACTICVDSNASDAVYMQGGNNAHLIADSLRIVGEYDTTGSTTPELDRPAALGSRPCGDPYAGALTHNFLTATNPVMPSSPTCTTSYNSTTHVLTVSSSGNCTIAGSSLRSQTGNGDTIVMPGGNVKVTGGWTIQNRTVTLTPGTYWITGGDISLGSNGTLQCSGCSTGGAGVTIILTTDGTTRVGNFTMQSNPDIRSLNAPGSGPFENLLLIQDSNGLPTGTDPTGNNTFQGGANQTFEGLVYFPKTHLDFHGNPTSDNGCLLTVAKTITLVGNTASTLASTGCPSGDGIGGVPGGAHNVYTVSLVE